MHAVDAGTDRSAKREGSPAERRADPLKRRLADPVYARTFGEFMDSLVRGARAAAAHRRVPPRLRRRGEDRSGPTLT